jgi:hypothetical protein
MIERHQHHDKPAQQVHRFQPLTRISDVGWPAGGFHLFLETLPVLEHKRNPLQGKSLSEGARRVEAPPQDNPFAKAQREAQPEKQQEML